MKIFTGLSLDTPSETAPYTERVSKRKIKVQGAVAFCFMNIRLVGKTQCFPTAPGLSYALRLTSHRHHKWQTRQATGQNTDSQTVCNTIFTRKLHGENNVLWPGPLLLEILRYKKHSDPVLLWGKLYCVRSLLQVYIYLSHEATSLKKGLN